MDLHDWLIAFHLIAAFVAIAALVALWAIVFATRGENPSLQNADAMRIGNIAGPMVGIGMTITLIFGLWLAFEVDAYEIWDAWIVASLLLWIFGAVTGAMSGKVFAKNDGSLRGKAVRLQTINTLAVVAILVLMIWKPGA